MKNPQRLTAQAIQDYAPGKEVVVSNLVFPVEGILMQGNAHQGNSVETKISYCVCGYISRTNAEAPRNCPRCDKKMLSVVDGHHQHYALAIEPVSYIAGESRRSEKKNIRKSFIQPELLGMEPWEDISDVYYRLRTSVQDESTIIFHNKGEDLGFALCVYCGKM